MTNNPFARHCETIARRFLLTAIVVDDELRASGNSQAVDLAAPGRGRDSLVAPAEPSSGSARPLKVDPITWAFAQEGMVCGVVSPRNGRHGRDAIATAAARADILILDWRLNQESDENALPLLERVLTGDPPHRLRLVAFYTGEPDHDRIRNEIKAHLEALDASELTPEIAGGEEQYIDFGACRIVVYGKPGSPIFGRATTVDEADIADRLIGDFAGMVEGLLPCIVLTALGAVRENVYRVLQSFGKDLDPAFLTHRACLTQPAEADEHMVEQIASELQGIMDDAVGQESPARIEVIEDWLNGRFGDAVKFSSGPRATIAQVVAMLMDGLDQSWEPLSRKARRKAGHRILSDGLAGGDQEGENLALRLASAMSFRQVHADTFRQLSMGTVVRCLGSDTANCDDPTLLLCVTPRCDSVRLKGPSSFLFAPLVSPRSGTRQVVMSDEGDEHRRVTIEPKPSQWVTAGFDPDPERECVLASHDGPGEAPAFKCVHGELYSWVGELKAEVAQSVAQEIAARMGRVPLNKSEWLRRMER